MKKVTKTLVNKTMSNISIKLNLLQLICSVKKMQAKSGLIDCLVIPIEQNHLFKGEKGIYLDIMAFEIKNKKGDSKDTHLLKQSLPKEDYEALTDEEKKEIPIIGNAILWTGFSEQEPKSSVAPISEDDDLPF